MRRFEATLTSSRRRRDGAWNGREFTFHAGEATLTDFIAKGRLADGPRAAALLSALGIAHASPTPDDYRGDVVLLLEDNHDDRPPRIVGYEPTCDMAAAPEMTPAAALDAITGDRRRRRPEAVAAARRAAKAVAADGQVHHDFPKRAGGGDEPGNLVPVDALGHARIEALRRAAEAAVPFGLHIATVVGRRLVADGEGVRLDIGGVEIFARSPIRYLGPLMSGRAAVLLAPDDGRRFRFRIDGAAFPEDNDAVERLRRTMKGA